MENTFGKAKYGNTGGSFKKRATLKPGSNVKRILPPFGSLAPSGRWAHWHSQHFGWNGTNKNNPDKPIPRPFKCMFKRNFTTKMVEVDCAACQELESKKAELEQLQAELKSSGASKKDIAAQLEPFTKWIYEHGLDKKWYLNTMLPNGDFELTAISNTCKQRLDEVFKKAQTKYRIDPIDPEQGVWVDFKRIVPNGQLRDADDQPELVMEEKEINGVMMEAIKLAPLTEDILTRAARECTDLPKQFMEISADQVERLVECSGEPEDVDAILGMSQPVKAEVSPVPAPAVKAQPAVAGKPPVTVPVVAKPATVKVATMPTIPVTKAEATEVVSDDNEAKAKQFAALFGD